MGEIVAALATTHAPQLPIRPEETASAPIRGYRSW